MYIVNNVFFSSFSEIKTDELFEKYNKGLIQLNIYVNSSLNQIIYLNNGVVHREGDPAIIIYDNDNGQITSELYYINGKLHRENNPAVIYYLSNVKRREAYYINGQLHRENGPAIIEYYIIGDISIEEYYVNGVLHRENNPARIRYTFSGKKFKEEYFKNGLRHREDGPSLIEYNKNEISKKLYFYNNMQISINKVDFSYNELIDKIKRGKRIQKLYSNKILINMSNTLTNEEKTILHDMNDSKILLECL